jgi:hypothetical protein
MARPKSKQDPMAVTSVFNRLDSVLNKIAKRIYKQSQASGLRSELDMWQDLEKYRVAVTMYNMKRDVDLSTLPYITKPFDFGVDPEDRYAECLSAGVIHYDVTYKQDKREALYALVYHALALFKAYVHKQSEPLFELLDDALKSLSTIGFHGYAECELYGEDHTGYTLVPTEWKEAGNEYKNLANRLKGD